MGLLIDTGVFIQLERSGQASADALVPWSDEEWFLSCITASELLHGVHRPTEEAARTRREAFVEAILAQFLVLPIDLVTARSHARIWAQLAAQGQLIGPHDMWLAATCIAMDLSLLTTNPREFHRVPGLRVAVWTPCG